MAEDDPREPGEPELPPTQRYPSSDSGLGESSGRREAKSSEPSWEVTAIRGYRLLEPLGWGGMGEVYEAEQLEPLRRKVAIKVLKLGMASREIIARFELETQALAMLDHSSIARIFDAGVTLDGRPYFAMELVQGLQITAYCDLQRLSTRQRLELFIKVCRAVQHAHQKGIMHRDLKPSNVLVTLQDGEHTPKVIDFGLAKAIAQPLTEHSRFTAHGQMIGTLEYMSPEQTVLEGLDLDTRTDVYSLGVILYELVAGTRPFDAGELSGAGFAEIQRKIQEDDPPRPSTRVSSPDARVEATARRRRSSPQILFRRLKGDLDWIVMKALEKDRDRRYETVDALAQDVQASLNHEPIRAGRPSATYRIRKFIRRHRVGTLAGSLLLMVVIGSAIAMGLLASRIADERDRANMEAATAQKVSDFLVGLFEVADPEEGRGDSITVREVLASGARNVEQSLGDQPLVQARLMEAIGRSYTSLGLFDEAEPQLEKSLENRRSELGKHHPETIRASLSLSDLRGYQGQHAEQEAIAREALAELELAAGEHSHEIALSLRSLGWSLMQQDRYDEAEPYLRRALEIRRSALSPSRVDIAESLFDLGTLLLWKGAYPEAEPLLLESIELNASALGPDHPRVRHALDALGGLYWTVGRLNEAEETYRKSLEIMEGVLGPKSYQVGRSLLNLAVMFDAQGRSAEAAAMTERAADIYRATFGVRHADYGLAIANLAWMRYRVNDLESAGPLYLEALEVFEGTLGPDHTKIATLLFDYSLLLNETGRQGQAIAALERSAAIREKALGPDHSILAESLASLGDLLKAQGELELAMRHYRRALSIRETSLGPRHADTDAAREALAQLLEAMGRPREADELRRSAESES